VRKTQLSVGVISLALLAAGCGGMRSGVEGAVKQKCARPAVRGANLSLAAVVTRPLSAFRTPGHRPIGRFGLLNINGVDSVFGVLGQTCDGSWLHVQLPLRPNGATGWVRADHVRQFPVHTRIVVDVSARTVRFFRDGRLVVRTTAAVGSSATPTPLGRYYVNQRLIPSDPGGPFGPGALGISAFSPVLTGWVQGGPVAIHGTNEPWSIGHAVSNGCIRIPNAVLKRMFARTPAGTPVIIEA
jgi:hypothetical protein